MIFALVLHASDSDITLPSASVDSSFNWNYSMYSVLIGTIREVTHLRFLLANARMAIVSVKRLQLQGCQKEMRELLLVAIALEAIVGLCGSVIQDLEAPV